MMKFSLLATLLGTAAAFAPDAKGFGAGVRGDPAAAEFFEVGGEFFDPLGLGKMHEIAGSFPNMFPHPQFMGEAEIKHGRMAMIAWTGVWITECGIRFPGAVGGDDWTSSLGVWAKNDPASFGAVLAFIAVAEGEGVSHAGDNFRGMSKKVAGDMGFDWMAMGKNDMSEHYRVTELKNGRAAMIGMASLFAWKAIPGSVPLMDLFTQNN